MQIGNCSSRNGSHLISRGQIADCGKNLVAALSEGPGGEQAETATAAGDQHVGHCGNSLFVVCAGGTGVSV